VSKVFLLRHGALAGDSRECFIGQIDLPLAPEGIRQAEAQAEALRGRDIEAVHSSDLLRCRQTAEIVAERLGVAHRLAPGLREISLGAWEGLPRREVAARWPREYEARGRDIAGFRVPGGESFVDCRRRVLAAWKRLLAEASGNIAVVGHAGVNRLLICHVLGLPTARLFQLGQDYGCINVIEQEGGRSCVRLLNGHAEDLRP
jgi:alpha-ribazole phosphatase